MSKQIAKTILEQLKGTTPLPVIWSWGTHAYQYYKEGDIEGIDKHLGGLKFKVKGHHFKGHVLISLAYDDTYTIHYGHVRKNKFKGVKNSQYDVHFNELGDLIDKTIEKLPEYSF